MMSEMVGKIHGEASKLNEKSLLIETGGLGYVVNVLPETIDSLPAELSLWTYLAVREDALELYGFLKREELEFFKLLVGVSGIGPKSALAILALAPPATLHQAIASGKSEYLTRVSGIGRKSAEKIVLELRDKLGRVASDEANFVAEEDALDALQTLGYGLREAREALRDLPAEIKDVGDRIKAALKILSQKH